METSKDTDILDDAIQAAIDEYDHAMGAADRLELPAKATISEAENDRTPPPPPPQVGRKG